MGAASKAQINKTGRDDARGIAQMMRKARLRLTRSTSVGFTMANPRSCEENGNGR